MRVVGLDFALAITGIANLYADEGPASCHAYRIRSGQRKGHERLEHLLDRILADAQGADLVVMEGIAYNAFDAGKALAGGWWVVKHALWQDGLPVAVVPPASLKSYATGRGDSKKDVVMGEVNGNLFPFAWAPDHDSADATVLAHLGARYLGAPLDHVPLDRQTAMMKAEWPGERAA